MALDGHSGVTMVPSAGGRSGRSFGGRSGGHGGHVANSDGLSAMMAAGAAAPYSTAGSPKVRPPSPCSFAPFLCFCLAVAHIFGPTSASWWRRGFCVTGLEKKTWPPAAALADIAEIYRIHRKVCKEQCWWGACRIRRRSCRR